MDRDRLLLDTVFVQALLNRRDQYHAKAQSLLSRVRMASEVWVTEAVLIEIGNALSAIDRGAAVDFIERCYRTANIHIVSVDTVLFTKALALFAARPDKSWGLTDSISFSVMAQQGLTSAVTADVHFLQAGYQALMLEQEG